MRVTSGTVFRLMSSLITRSGVSASHSSRGSTAQQVAVCWPNSTLLRPAAGRPMMTGPAQLQHGSVFAGSTPFRSAWTAGRVPGSGGERTWRAAALVGGGSAQCLAAESGSSSARGIMPLAAAAAHAVARRKLSVTARSLASEEAPSASSSASPPAAAAPVTTDPAAAAAGGVAGGAAAGGWSPDFESGSSSSSGNGVDVLGRPSSNGVGVDGAGSASTSSSSGARGFSTSAGPSSSDNGGSAGSESAAGSASSSGNTAAAPAQQQQQPQQLVLLCGASMLPHPDKAHRGGEDAFFIADPPRALGVADGVGGWAEVGVDAGAYARLLMAHAKEEAEAVLSNGSSSSSSTNSGDGDGDGSAPAAAAAAAGTAGTAAAPPPAVAPHDVLERAYYRTNVQGSSTACVVAINGATLVAANLGDSGFVLVRDGKAAFQSPQQVHAFNFPYQLGSADGGASDHPGAAMRIELATRPGDILITGTDGLWDNVFADEAAAIVARCRTQGDTPEAAAHTLCRYARMRATDPKHHSPFSYAAMQAGYVFLGGKLDDITVVVAYVAQAAAKL